MKQEILTYLRNHKPYAGSTLAEYLGRTMADKSQREVKDALQGLIDEQSIEVPAGMLTQVFDDAHLAQPMAQFHNQFDGISISWQGERRWEDVESMGRAVRLNESLIETNNSIRSLNGFQRIVSTGTVLVALASFFAIAAPLCKRNDGVKSTDVQAITDQLKANTAILDNLKRQAQNIDSSLRKIAKDTLRHKFR